MSDSGVHSTPVLTKEREGAMDDIMNFLRTMSRDMRIMSNDIRNEMKQQNVDLRGDINEIKERNVNFKKYFNELNEKMSENTSVVKHIDKRFDEVIESPKTNY